jgi:S1-C subfamily serine protease
MIDYPAVIKKVKPSIALILALDAKGEFMGTGSGFVFIKKGILVTCNHVVAGANSFLIKFSGSTQTLQGKVVVKDDEHDLALIKFSDDSREPLIMGEMEKIVEGMSVIFSGYPFSSEDLTTHQGILSSITKDATGITTYLIDGTVNSGNSGCPLMDSSGRVIGVVNAKRVVQGDVLEKIRGMKTGAVSLYGVDLIRIYQALIGNLQLGVGYAIPASYIPEHKEIDEVKDETIKK